MCPTELLLWNYHYSLSTFIVWEITDQKSVKYLIYMIWGSTVIQVWNDTRVSKWQQNCFFDWKEWLYDCSSFRFAILRWDMVMRTLEQLHGACWCPKSIPFRQLSLCSEHTETDAGEGDWTQCLPPGHVQEKVWICVVLYHIHIGNSYIYCHHSNNNTYFFRNLHDDATPNGMCSKLRPYCVWICHVSYECLCFHPEITCWSTVCSLSDMLCWDILCLWSCQDAEAFELSSSGFTNGVFIKFLKERLLEDEKITVLLDRVAEGERTLSMLKLNEAWPLLLVNAGPLSSNKWLTDLKCVLLLSVLTCFELWLPLQRLILNIKINKICTYCMTVCVFHLFMFGCMSWQSSYCCDCL